MKKFKHKNTGEIATYENGVLKSSGFCVEIGVEPSSEFWEEIVDKTYEILSFRQSGSGYFWTYFEGKGWCRNEDDKPVTNPHATLDSILNNHLKGGIQYYIHSVKRLSDSEIFTVGDKLSDGILDSIEITNDKTFCYIRTIKYNTKIVSSNPITEVSRLKKLVLFTTADNVDICEGDKYYYVYQKGTSGELVTSYATCISTQPLGIKQFASEQNCAEWILMNKPCLSINEIIGLLEGDHLPVKSNKSFSQGLWVFNKTSFNFVKSLQDYVKNK